MEALRGAVEGDSVLHELAQTPLMLSIMSIAYQGARGDELAATQEGDFAERRKQVFSLYVEQMFQRKGTTSFVFPREKIIRWLSWLARKMREQSQSVFLVEGLRPSWLGTRGKRVAYGTIVALIFGLIVGLSGGLKLNNGLLGLIGGLAIFVGVALGCWSKSPLKNGIVSGAIIWLIVGLIAGLGLRDLMAGLIGGLTLGLTTGLMVGLGVGTLNYIHLVESVQYAINRAVVGVTPM